MYRKSVQSLLKNIPVVPVELAVTYLKKTHEITDSVARQSIYKATKAGWCIQQGEYLMRRKDMNLNSTLQAQIKAFAVIIHFLPQSANFCEAKSPWIYAFLKGDGEDPQNNKLIQITTFSAGNEFTKSKLLATTQNLDADERKFVRRIAVVEDGCNIDKILRVGINSICSVAPDYTVKVLKNIPLEEVWLDV